ncbi:TonB-dependent receptor [Flavobacteriaceae bacterium]|nr:TonB-dependent receptor [Flavobacteriaceae bacterium]MDA8704114.1 TonB-dependent receptor [Flavobacteriaceae bacterium]MDA9817790.1 TonB-dependent receptor [Flavobacteriaceae bacterium]MDB2365987.1 TonB-dependent receptor [Flavobacteriaceae bacterium]MDC0879245.1 TonB-dependent receptor [Flavobacteriaceae bacterium]
MKNILNKYYLAFMAVILFGSVYSQTQISGSVMDAGSMEAIPGVNVIIDGTNIGTVTDFDGNFVINTSQDAPLTLIVSYVGYSAERVSITSANQNINVSLSAGQNLEEIIISASRRAQKVTDAPASVSVISTRQIENSAQVAEPSRILVSVPGVQIQQQTANSMNIEMRAGSGVFGTSTYIMRDNRGLITPAAGTFFSFQQGLSNLDLASVEIVRGAAGVLYGPGVTSGVVHFRSKSPIDYTGNAVSMWGGDLNTFGSEFRIARANDDKTFGWKINARVNSGDDFTYDDEAALAANVGGINSIIRQPVITNMAVDPLLSANGDVLYDFTGGNAIFDTYSNFTVDTNLEWRPSDDTNYQVSAGMTNGGGLFFQDLGIGYADGSTYWGQVQATVGNWYAQAFIDHNDGGGTDNPTFLYGTGLRQVAKRTTMEAQIQYNFDMPWLFDSEWTVGYDYRNTDSDSEYTLWGRNEDSDDYITNGIYGQGTLTMSEKVDLVVAGRYDQASFISAGEFAPRAALVYKPSEKTTWRLSYNKALTGPSALQMYIDFPVNVPAPGVLDAWLSGQSTAQRFADPANQVIDLAGIPIDIPVSAAGGGLPLAIPYGSVAGASLAGLYAQAPSLQPLLTPFFANYMGPQGGSGILSPYDLFEPTQTTGNRNTRTGRFSSVENFELGFSSVIGKKLKISADIYSYVNTGFTNFSAIGDAYALVGSNIPGDLGAAVAADATAYVTGALTAVTTQTYQGLAAQFGLPFEVVASGALAAQGVPSLEASIAGGIAQTLGGINGAFQAGGAGFVSALGPLFGAIGAVESDRVPQGDGITHITTGYITQGDAKRSHFGGDISMDYFANADLRLWANASWLSQNEWIPGEDNDDDLLNTSYLNAPAWKWRMGMDYTPISGLQFGMSFQHDDKFRSVQGFWNGMVETKNLIDMSVGYRFNPGLRFDISATNLTDNGYKTYPNLPTIRRRVLGKLTFNF